MVCQICGDPHHTLCLKDKNEPCPVCKNLNHSICNGIRNPDNKRLFVIACHFSRNERKAEKEARTYFQTKTELEIEDILTNHTKSMTSIIKNNCNMDMSFNLEDIFVTYVMEMLRYIIYMEQHENVTQANNMKTLLGYVSMCDNCGCETCKCDEINSSEEYIEICDNCGYETCKCDEINSSEED